MFLQQDQCDAKISNNTKLIDKIVKCNECECLKLGDTYTFVRGKCYYVEVNLFNFTDAMENCQNQFGSNHTGKVIIRKSRIELSLAEQDTIENVC